MRNAIAQITKLVSGLGALFRPKKADAELDAELRDYLDASVAEKMKAGMSYAEAGRAARLEMGSMEAVKDDVRAVGWEFLVQTVWQDIRFAFRMLRKAPGFTTVAVLTLALGIGANTAIFSILESQLWRALPFPDSERLVDLHPVLRKNHRQWDVLSVRGFEAWRDQSHSFASLAGYFYPGFRNLTANGTSERVQVMPIAPNFFDTFEIPVARGRAFLPGEDVAGRDHLAILTDSLWREQFGSDPRIVGEPVTIDGESFTVVGITPPTLRFEFIEEPSIFVPMTLDRSAPVNRDLYVIGRLAPGVTATRASEELTAILDREMKSEGVQSEDVGEVTNLRWEWTHFAAPPLYFFAGAVALVLLIACVNTAALLFAKGLARQREFALRAALGASRRRVVGQLLVETAVLALAGGGAGAFAGVWLASSFAAYLPENALARHTPVTLDARVFAFTLGISVISALLAGLLPAVFASRADLSDSLRQNAPGRSASRGQRYIRGSLVGAEVALGLVLLFGAGLFLSTFVRLEKAPRGFDAPGALTFQISLRGESYAKPDQIERYFDLLMAQLGSTPGVRGVTLGSGLPLTGDSLFSAVNVRGRPPIGPHGAFLTLRSIAPNYFDLLHMKLLAGRTFNSGDTQTSPRVAIIDRNAAQKLFGPENPLGKVLDFVADERRGVPAEAPAQIVGVVDRAQEFNANEDPFEVLYLPFSQHAVPSEFALVSSDVPRGALAGAIRAAAYSLDKDEPVFDMKTMDDRIVDSLSGARFDLFLVGALAAVAMLLVSVGTFGMVAYFVEQRTQEFGIRLALGATPAKILRHAIAQSLLIGAAGLLTGVMVALIVGRLLGQTLYLVPHEHEGMLYGVRIYDPLSLGGACALLVVVVFLASYIPARRAARVDPLVAIRYE